MLVVVVVVARWPTNSNFVGQAVINITFTPQLTKSIFSLSGHFMKSFFFILATKKNSIHRKVYNNNNIFYYQCFRSSEIEIQVNQIINNLEYSFEKICKNILKPKMASKVRLSNTLRRLDSMVDFLICSNEVMAKWLTSHRPTCSSRVSWSERKSNKVSRRKPLAQEKSST